MLVVKFLKPNCLMELGCEWNATLAILESLVTQCVTRDSKMASVTFHSHPSALQSFRSLIIYLSLLSVVQFRNEIPIRSAVAHYFHLYYFQSLVRKILVKVQ